MENHLLRQPMTGKSRWRMEIFLTTEKKNCSVTFLHINFKWHQRKILFSRIYAVVLFLSCVFNFLCTALEKNILSWEQRKLKRKEKNIVKKVKSKENDSARCWSICFIISRLSWIELNARKRHSRGGKLGIFFCILSFFQFNKIFIQIL